MEEWQEQWLVDDANEGNADAVSILIRIVADCFANGVLPSPAIRDWYIGCAGRIPSGGNIPQDSDKRARHFASAFNYGKKKGQPRRCSYEKFCIVREVYRIQRSKKVSREEAMDNFVTENPNAVISEGSTEYIRDLCEQYMPLVVQSHEEWEERMRLVS